MKLPQSVLILTLTAMALLFSAVGASEQDLIYVQNGKKFFYSVTPAGENYNFEFRTNPGGLPEKLQASHHILQSQYRDFDIETHYSQHYIRERANCYIFESTWHDYTVCLLPNEFSTGKRERFWGFITQLPNWKWMLTRNFIPAVLAIGLIFIAMTPKKPLKSNNPDPK